MKKTKPPVQLVENATKKFLTDNLSILLQGRYEPALNLANKLLISRTADEICAAESFVNTILHEHTDVVDALNIALDDNQPDGQRGFQNGKKYEYFAVLTALLARKIQPWAKESAEREPGNEDVNQLISWAEGQLDKSIETVIECYVDIMFPGQEDDLIILLDLAIEEFFRRAFPDVHGNFRPEIEAFFKEFIFAAPGSIEVFEAFFEDYKIQKMSEAAAKAGHKKGKGVIPQKEYAIEKYKVRNDWDSRSQAAGIILSKIKKKYPRIKLTKSKDDGKRRVYDWLCAYDKQSKKQK